MSHPIKDDGAMGSIFNVDYLREKAKEQLKVIEPPPRRKSTYSYAELHKLKDEEQKFIIPDLIPANAVTVLLGEDGIGKTQICTQLCLAIAFRYQTFFGLPLTSNYGRALICATEESRKKWIRACVKQAYALEPQHNPEKVLVEFTEGSDFDEFLGLKDELETLLNTHRYDLIIVDALSDIFSLIDGDINSSSHARRILSFFQHLCDTYETTIIIIHHAAKTKIVAKQKEGKLFVEKNDAQGAGAITQKARTVLALSNDPKSVNEDGTEYTNYFHVVKANLMGKRFVNTAIQLRFEGKTLLHKPIGYTNIEMNQTEVQASTQASPVNRNRKALPRELTIEQHIAALEKVFEKQKIYTSRKEIIPVMSAHYDVGTVKIDSAGGYLSYVMEQGLVVLTEAGYMFRPPVLHPIDITTRINPDAEFDDGFEEEQGF